MKDRGKRIENKERIIKKRKKFLKNSGDKSYLDKFEGEENRLASKHPYDCGNAKCDTCHPHKNRPTKNKRKVDRINTDILLEEIDCNLFNF